MSVNKGHIWRDLVCTRHRQTLGLAIRFLQSLYFKKTAMCRYIFVVLVLGKSSLVLSCHQHFLALLTILTRTPVIVMTAIPVAAGLSVGGQYDRLYDIQRWVLRDDKRGRPKVILPAMSQNALENRCQRFGFGKRKQDKGLYERDRKAT
jgi:hypothetical protein